MGKLKKIIMLILVLLILVLSSWAGVTRNVPYDKQSIIKEVIETK